ncbi:MAG: S-layer homology domain-containing protein [Bacillaceae bacterium]|nr:S-layer homology domain-containing protein [Bacillaceae bacterium]
MKKWTSMILTFMLIVTSFGSIVNGATTVDSLADRLTRIYNYLNDQEKEAIYKARERAADLSMEEWKDIFGETVFENINHKTGDQGAAESIITDLVNIIYATPQTDFKDAIDDFRETYADEFDAVFGGDVTVDTMLGFIDTFETKLEAVIAATMISGDEATFDQVVQEAIEWTIADGYEDLDGKLYEGIGIGIDGLFQIKDRLNDAIDPDGDARDALISGVARGKGAAINGPDAVTAGETASYTFTVNYQGSELDLTDDVKWTVSDESVASLSGNSLTAHAEGQVTIEVIALGVTILSKDVDVIAESGAGGGGAGGGGAGGGGGGGGALLPPGKDRVDWIMSGEVIDVSAAAQVEQTTTEEGRSRTEVNVDAAAFIERLEQSESDHDIVLLKVEQDSDDFTINLPDDAFRALQENNKTLAVWTSNGIYLLPGQVLDLDQLAEEMGTETDDLQIELMINKAVPETADKVKQKAAEAQALVVAEYIDFNLRVTAGTNTKTITSFGYTYVDRMLKVDGSAERDNMVGVMYDDKSGRLIPVPTVFTETEDGVYAIVKRNGNSTYTVVSRTKTFHDIEGHWAQDTIEKLASKMIVEGMTETEYRPQENLTRAQLATLVVRALGLVEVEGESPFTDVKQNDWFAGYVNAAVEAGLIEGYMDGTFQPDRLVTRQETAAIMVRAARYAGKDMTMNETEQEIVLTGYEDHEQVDAWARNEIATAIEKGLMSGYQGQIRPQAHSTRAESAAFIEKLMQAVGFMD